MMLPKHHVCILVAVVSSATVLASAVATTRTDSATCQSDSVATKKGSNFIQRVRDVDVRITNLSPQCQEYPGKRIVLVTVNSQFVDMFANWLFHAKSFLKDTEQLYVVAEDEGAYTAISTIEKKSDFRFPYVRNHAHATLLDGKFPFDSKQYGQLVNKRPGHILKFLDKGCSVLYVDIDTVWLEDPFQEIAKMASKDSHHELYLTHDTCQKDNPTTCTCFMYVQPTQNTKKLMKDWANLLSTSHANRNQAAFNKVLKKATSGEAHSLNWIILPKEKFPPGCTRKHDSSPAVLHANYRIGHEAKVKFLRDAGYWLGDHNNVSALEADASPADKHDFHKNTQSIHDTMYDGVGKSISDVELKKRIHLVKKHSKAGGMEEQEYFAFMSYVRDHAPQRLLVWGMGYDSIMLDRLNEGGTTLFLEMDASWVAKTDAKHLNYYSYDAKAFNTQVSRWKDFLQNPHSAKIHDIAGQCFDTILVDSPLGYHSTDVGRGVPIYTAKQTADHCKATNPVTVFVHDCNREAEKQFSSHFLGEAAMELGPKKLRKFIFKAGDVAAVQLADASNRWLIDDKSDTSMHPATPDASSHEKFAFYKQTVRMQHQLYHGVGRGMSDADLKDRIHLIKKHSKLGGMEEQEYFAFMSYVRDHAPQRLLVWGMGYDSVLIDRLNEGGTTLFLEMDATWVAKTDAKHLNYLSYDAQAFKTTVARWKEFLDQPHGAKIHDIAENCYDTILVDSPLGYQETDVGRGVPIYTAKLIADHCKAEHPVTVFVHDCNREAEQQFATHFLGEPEVEIGPKKLRKHVLTDRPCHRCI